MKYIILTLALLPLALSAQMENRLRERYEGLAFKGIEQPVKWEERQVMAQKMRKAKAPAVTPEKK